MNYRRLKPPFGGFRGLSPSKDLVGFPLPNHPQFPRFLPEIRALAISLSGKSAAGGAKLFTLLIIYRVEKIAAGHGEEIDFFTIVLIFIHLLGQDRRDILSRTVEYFAHTGRNGIRQNPFLVNGLARRHFALFLTTFGGRYHGKREQKKEIFHLNGSDWLRYICSPAGKGGIHRKSKVLEKSNFVDQIRIFCRSGHGGAGNKHFMRNKFTALGGPDGGDGGRGAHIILKGNSNLWTLLHLRYYKNVLAEDGERGGANNCHGRDGKDIIIEVPLGTIARDEESGKQEAEILEDGQEIIWMPGGKGGLGNSHFATPTNQAPEHAQPGLPGEEGWKVLELKVLADVGLVGFPNAGKSTLLSVITAAKPKIANYAFTTLTPNLGMVEYRDGKSFCIADLPGIIEGAAEGKGLGHRFLRHIERNSVLLFLVPADSDDHKKEFDILVSELEQYNPELLHKQFIIAISKSDMLDDELKQAIEKELPAPIPHVFISSVTNKGLTELKDLLWTVLNQPAE